MNTPRSGAGAGDRDRERSEERYRTLVDIAPAGILAVDHDGRISFANQRLCTIVGLDHGQVVGAMPAELVDPHHEAQFVAAFSRLAGGGSGDYDFELHRRDGTTRWVHITSKPFLDADGFAGALVVASDITDRRHATDRLRLQAALLEAVGEAIIATDPDGRVIFWNDAAERLYGWTAAEVLGHSAAEVVPSVVSMNAADEVSASPRRGVSWRGELEVRRKDGTSFPAMVFDSAVLDDRGEVTAVIEVSIDMTHQVEATRAVEARAAQQTAVATVAELALSDTTMTSLLHTALEQVVIALDADIGELVVRTADGGLRLEAGHGLEPDLVSSVSIPIDVPSFAGTTIDRDAGVLCGDITADSELALAPYLHDRGIVGGAGVVIRVGGVPLGAVCVFDCTKRTRTHHDLTVMQSIADLVANSMHRLTVLRELDRRAVTDDLTGLPNRAAFLDRLTHALGRRDRYDQEVAVLFADLDHFKDVNDAFGHGVGDDLIRAVGQRISGAVRAGDTVARFGGDEFAILCDPVDGPEPAIAVAERITRAVQLESFDLGDREVTRSLSVGIAVSSDHARSADVLLRDADAAMYRAKAAGGGRVDLFDEGIQEQLIERFDLSTALRRGIEAGELELHYQPEIALLGSGHVWAEALVRWRHPDRGLMAPAAFIGLAEETGLIVPLGAWVIETAIAQFAEWRRLPDPSPSSISVNISARQLLEADFIERTGATIERHGVEPGTLWFELTETSLLREPERSLAVLHDLRDLGIGLAIDDFGTGYASLAYAQRLPIDALKIDRTFVNGLLVNRRDEGIVRAVIEMARSFGILAIAEGVETQDQLDELRRLGCHFAQGYLISRPVPRDDLLAWTAEWSARTEAETSTTGDAD